MQLRKSICYILCRKFEFKVYIFTFYHFLNINTLEIQFFIFSYLLRAISMFFYWRVPILAFLTSFNDSYMSFSVLFCLLNLVIDVVLWWFFYVLSFLSSTENSYSFLYHMTSNSNNKYGTRCRQKSNPKYLFFCVTKNIKSIMNNTHWYFRLILYSKNNRWNYRNVWIERETTAGASQIILFIVSRLAHFYCYLKDNRCLRKPYQI